MIELQELRVVVAVAEHGTLVRAARVLGLSQPNVSRILATLEAKLQGKLFERHRHGAIPTNLARVLLAETSDIPARMQQLEQRLLDVSATEPELRIATANYAADMLGLRAAALTSSRHPTLRVRLLPADWVETPRVIIAREASLGLFETRAYEPDPSLVLEKLEPQPSAFLVRRDHPLTRLPTVTLRDIARYPMMLISRIQQSIQHPILTARELVRAEGRTLYPLPAIVCQNPISAVEHLQYCDAVTPGTLQIGGTALRAGEVVAVRWRDPWVAHFPGIVRLRSHAPSETEQEFMQNLRDIARDCARENAAWLKELGLSAACQ